MILRWSHTLTQQFRQTSVALKQSNLNTDRKISHLYPRIDVMFVVMRYAAALKALEVLVNITYVRILLPFNNKQPRRDFKTVQTIQHCFFPHFITTKDAYYYNNSLLISPPRKQLVYWVQIRRPMHRYGRIGQQQKLILQFSTVFR